jgi:hypothetical protein
MGWTAAVLARLSGLASLVHFRLISFFLRLRLDFDRFSFDQILRMSTTRWSLASRSLARELVVHMLSHLPSLLLQPPWREVRTTLLNYFLHFPFLLPFRVILFHRLIFFCLGILVLALIRVHFLLFNSRDVILGDSLG